MKKIFKFVAPNGEYVKWGEFDDKKKIVTFEVEKFADDGELMEKQTIDFVLPDDLDIKSEWKLHTSYRASGFLKCERPRQLDDYKTDSEEDGDPELKPRDKRNVLTD